MPRGSPRRDAIVKAAIDVLAEIAPCSVRAVCYRLFTMGVILSMAKSNTNTVSKALTWAREHGFIRWPAIVDETRAPETVAMWRDLDDYRGAVLDSYRRDVWRDQPVRIEVWSEKGTIRGTLAPVLNDLRVTFRVFHGNCSTTVVHNIAAESQQTDAPLVAFYVGDLDPSGAYMSDVDLPERLNRHGARNVTFQRLALTVEDTQNLPNFEAKKTDTRWRWYVERYGRRCWELDAMSPAALRERVREAIEARIELDSWDHSLAAERTDRAELEALFDGLA